MSGADSHLLAALDVEVIPDCILCAGEAGRPDPQFASLLALPPAYGVLHCRTCGLRWLSPRPTRAGYELVYSDAFYFGGGAAAVDSYADLAQSRRPYFRDRLARIEAQLPGASSLRVLEVGAATGEFLAEARSRGHLTTGVEFSADARRTAAERHGLQLLSVEASADLPAGAFDAIHMNHVLEHVPDPLAHLRWCRERLRPGGVMVIEVPQQLENDLDRLRRVFGWGGRHRDFDAYSLHHTYFFTPGSVRKLFALAGLDVQCLATANPMRTPLWPPVPRNLVLRPLLWLADAVHEGGNIIEVFARRDAGDQATGQSDITRRA